RARAACGLHPARRVRAHRGAGARSRGRPRARPRSLARRHRRAGTRLRAAGAHGARGARRRGRPRVRVRHGHRQPAGARRSHGTGRHLAHRRRARARPRRRRAGWRGQFRCRGLPGGIPVAVSGVTPQPEGSRMMQWIQAALAVVLAVSALPAQAAEPVPVEAFAAAAKVSSPRLSPDGKHIAVSVNLGEGNYAIVVYQVADMKQTAFLRMPRYELPVQTYWVSDRRLLVAKGRMIGSREKPLPMGEIIATDYDGSNQTYVYGWQQSTRTRGIGRGYG